MEENSFFFFSARAGDEPAGVGILATADAGPVRAHERTGGALILPSGRAHGKDDIQGRPCSAHATASPRPGKNLYTFKNQKSYRLINFTLKIKGYVSEDFVFYVL